MLTHGLQGLEDGFKELVNQVDVFDLRGQQQTGQRPSAVGMVLYQTGCVLLPRFIVDELLPEQT